MPFNFSWLMPGQVAGMARPRPDDVAWLKTQVVTAVVSLTEQAPSGMGDLETLHEPVRDMTPPTLDQIHRVIGFIEQELGRDGAVVIHCTAGMGRTGTLLAAWLVSRSRPGSIETRGQEEAIRQFAELMGVDPK